MPTNILNRAGGPRRLISFALVGLMSALTGFIAGAQTLDRGKNASDVAGILFEARRQQHAGKNSSARTILVEALSKAPESPVLLDALGSVQQDLGEYRGAEETYLHALAASARTAGDIEHIIVLNNLATLYLDNDQYSKGQWVRAELEKVPSRALENHPAEAALLLNVVGSLEHERNRDDNAVRYYGQALTLLRKVHGPVSADAAQVESNLGFLQLEMGQYPAAKEFFLQSLHEMESAVGTNDGALIQPLVNLARCENLSGDSDKAEILSRRAVEISSKTFGEQHPITAAAMLEQADTLRKLHRKSEARRLEKQAHRSLQSASAAGLPRYTIGFRQLAEQTSR
jgi:tetratricopeptide (TPR) repeat protein